jgi:hypothetical protein
VATAIALTFAILPVALAQADTDPPELVDFDFNPKSVDVTTGPAGITCTMEVTDSGAGTDFVMCIMQSPGNIHGAACSSDTPISGDIFNGIYTCTAPISQFVEEGTWRIRRVMPQDLYGNNQDFDTPDLQAMGFSTEFSVGFLFGQPNTVISNPADGKRVSGNSLTIKAELAQGNPDDVSPTLGVRFDSRPLPSGVFAPIPARNANHPNPDTTYPYFIHWDVSGVADGNYEIRAVAHDLDGIPDPLPETITITIAHTGVVDIDENFNEESVQESHSGVNNSGDSSVESADSIDASTVTGLVIPAGALTLSSDTAILSYSDSPSELSFALEVEQIVGAVVDFDLESGQTGFESGLTGDLTISYSDYDQDGYVDGTGIPEGELELRYYDPVAGVYVPMPGWTVMTEHNMVHADTPFTGRFAVIPEPSRWLLQVVGICFLALLYRRHVR